jgi:hypothetical protein
MVVESMESVLIVEDDRVVGEAMATHLNLTGLDGWRQLDAARGEGIGTPIVVVSARGPRPTGSTRSSAAPTTTS